MDYNTWNNSTETLLKNNAIHELKFHYNNGSKDLKNEIEKDVIKHIMQTYHALSDNVCNTIIQSDKSIKSAAELVEMYSPLISNDKKKELAKDIQATHHFDFTFINQDKSTYADRELNIRILGDFIKSILPEENENVNSSIENAIKNTDKPALRERHIITTSQSKTLTTKPTLTDMQKVNQPELISNNIITDINDENKEKTNLNTSGTGSKKESFLTNLLSNIYVSLYRLIAPH